MKDFLDRIDSGVFVIGERKHQYLHVRSYIIRENIQMLKSVVIPSVGL